MRTKCLLWLNLMVVLVRYPTPLSAVAVHHYAVDRSEIKNRTHFEYSSFFYNHSSSRMTIVINRRTHVC